MYWTLSATNWATAFAWAPSRIPFGILPPTPSMIAL